MKSREYLNEIVLSTNNKATFEGVTPKSWPK